MDSKSLLQGIKIESEHSGTYRKIKNYFKKNKRFPSNKQVFRMIASDHLKETPVYYSKLKKLKL